MSRSGYVDDDSDYSALWRGAVMRAITGKRGQNLLRETLAALDAMPEKTLAAESLVAADGEFCTLGALGNVKGINMGHIDPEDWDQVAFVFGVAPALIREIVYHNDEGIDDHKWVNDQNGCGARSHTMTTDNKGAMTDEEIIRKFEQRGMNLHVGDALSVDAGRVIDGVRTILAAQPAQAMGAAPLYWQWRNKATGQWNPCDDQEHAEFMRTLEHEVRALGAIAPVPAKGVRYDGDSETSRTAFRQYDVRNPVSDRTPWQIWRDACAWQAAAPEPIHASDATAAKCDLAMSVFGGLNVLRWLLNVTTEFDRKDIRTRQAARLLDEIKDSSGQTNRQRLEHLWMTLHFQLPEARVTEYLRGHDAPAADAVPVHAATQAERDAIHWLDMLNTRDQYGSRISAAVELIHTLTDVKLSQDAAKVKS